MSIKMGEIRAETPQIVPNSAQSLFDFGGGPVGVGGFEIFLPDAMLGQHWADPTQDTCGKIGDAAPIESAQAVQANCSNLAGRRVQHSDQPCPWAGRFARRSHLEHDDDFAEHLPALDSREAALELGKRDFECR